MSEEIEALYYIHVSVQQVSGRGLKVRTTSPGTRRLRLHKGPVGCGAPEPLHSDFHNTRTSTGPEGRI